MTNHLKNGADKRIKDTVTWIFKETGLKVGADDPLVPLLILMQENNNRLIREVQMTKQEVQAVKQEAQITKQELQHTYEQVKALTYLVLGGVVLSLIFMNVYALLKG